MTSRFAGFKRRRRTVPVPDTFFTEVLPQIDDLAEAKVALHALRRLLRAKATPRVVTLVELESDPILAKSLRAIGPSKDELRLGLEAAVRRGMLIALTTGGDPGEAAFALNSEEDRAALALDAAPRQTFTAAGAAEALPGTFSLYEKNVGLLTPLIAEAIEDAEREYPSAWIEEAIRLAVENNKRSWRYIDGILRRWRDEGRRELSASPAHHESSWDRVFGSGRDD